MTRCREHLWVKLMRDALLSLTACHFVRRQEEWLTTTTTVSQENMQFFSKKSKVQACVRTTLREWVNYDCQGWFQYRTANHQVLKSSNVQQFKSACFWTSGQFWINSDTMVQCFVHNCNDKAFEICFRNKVKIIKVTTYNKPTVSIAVFNQTITKLTHSEPGTT